MSVNVITFFSEITPQERIIDLIETLKQSGANIISPDNYDDEISHCYFFVGSGGTEEKIAKFLKDRTISDTITLLAHESSNSLPAAMETRTYLQSQGIPARVMHAPLSDLTSRIRDWTKFANILGKLSKSKIGIVGEPSSWLIASHIDRDLVRNEWGVIIEKYQLKDLISNMKSQLTEKSRSDIDRFIASANDMYVQEADIVSAGHVTQALLDVVNSNDLDAITVQCFALFEQTEVTGCLALSQLNDIDDIVAGCEGDIPSTFTLLITKLLTQEPAFMANVVELDKQANTVVLAHCTSPTEILANYDITTHFETGQGVAVKGIFDEQPVTVFKVFGKDLSDYWVSSGVIVENQYNECGCRTQVKVKLSEPVEYFLDDSLANHHVLLMGDHSDEIREFFSFKFREF